MPEPTNVGRGVLAAPAAWYDRPEADSYTRLTVTKNGEVYGHVAPWGASHRGSGVNSDVVRGDDYSEFHTGRVTTAEGTTLDIGHLTIGGGHADLGLGARAAAAHYDDVATAWAHVRASNGKHGIWVAGNVAPGVNDLTLHKAQAFPPSGDWRQLEPGGPYRMVACCQVVTPGFPVHEMRAQVASAAPMALVASAADWSGVTAAGDLPALGGPAFSVLIFPEGEVSRDGRSIDAGATAWGDGPWPLYRKLRETHGGEETEGTVMVGRIDRVERNAASEVYGYGTFDTSPEAVEAARLVAGGMLLGVSADLGEMRGTELGGEVVLFDTDVVEDEEAGTITLPDVEFDTAALWMTVQYAELIGATLCGKPAYREAQIVLDQATMYEPLPEDVPALAAGAARIAERIRPYTVVGRPAVVVAAVPTVEDRLAQVEADNAALRSQVAALTAALTEPAAIAASLAPAARTAALARLRRA